MNRIITAILIIIIGYSCQPPVNYSNDIPGLLEELKSEDTTIRFNALRRLPHIRFTEQESLQLIEAAAGRFPGAEYTYQSIPQVLIINATKYNFEKYISPIEQYFPQYDTLAKEQALQFLSGNEDATSIETFTRLLIKYQDEIEWFPSGILYKQHKYKKIIFPALMQVISHPSIGDDVQWLLTNYLENKSVNPSDYVNYLPEIIAQSDSLYTLITARQKKFAAMNDMWDDEDYIDIRYDVNTRLDLLSYIVHEGNKKHLQKWLGQNDNFLKLNAALALIRMGETVNDQVWLAIAADTETRNEMYNELVKLNKEYLYPKAYLTQEAFAESEFVSWLLVEAELGRKPDRIELMKVLTKEDETGEKKEFYVYRFRCDHVDWLKEGWMAGIAGGYAIKDKPTAESDASTYSLLESWEGKTPEEHLKYLTEE